MSSRRWILVGLGTLSALALAVAAGLFVLYYQGLRLAGPRPQYVPVEEQTALIRAAFYTELEGPVEPSLRRLDPIRFAFLISCQARDGDCSQRFPGHRTAALLARELSPPLRGLGRHLAHSALTLWLTRNWSLHEMLDTLTARAAFGKEIRGIRQASRRFFGSEPPELTPDQVAVLVVFTRRPTHSQALAACAPADLRRSRDLLLTDMVRAGALSGPAARRATEAPTPIRVDGVDCR